MIRLFFKHSDGTEYYNYKVEFLGYQYRREVSSDSFLFNSFARNDLVSDKYFDKTFVPNQGDEINVIPSCPISHDDIRKSYKIKRGYDTGVCNVFPTAPKLNYALTDYIILYPNCHLAVICSKNTTYNTIMSELNLSADAAMNPINLGTHTLFCRVLPEAYIELLCGRLKKPAISYKNLKIKGENQLTADAIYLVYRLGREKATQDNIKTFELQLKALSQTNWRDYPNVIKRLILIIKNNHAVGNYVLTHKACMSKQSRQFLDFKSSGETEDEFNLGKDMMKLIMNLDGTIFTTFEDMCEKLNNTGVGFNSFNHYFKNMLKISEKEFYE